MQPNTIININIYPEGTVASQQVSEVSEFEFEVPPVPEVAHDDTGGDVEFVVPEPPSVDEALDSDNNEMELPPVPEG